MSRLKVTLYGGVNEIGGNKFLLEEGERRLMLDFGTSIGARNDYYSEFLQPRNNAALRDLIRLGLLPRIDGVYREDLIEPARATTDGELPESAQKYRRRNGGNNFVDAVLLTHAHVDHFQDLSFLDPSIPVVSNTTTWKMIEAIEAVNDTDVLNEVTEIRDRLGEKKSNAYPRIQREHIPVEELAVQDVSGWRVMAIPADHSIPGACAFSIISPLGKRIFYSGDIRFHGRHLDRTKALRDAARGFGADVMLSEGTRINSEASDNETDVEKNVHDITKDASSLVVSEFAWKDTTRFDTIQRVAEATGRTLLIDPRLAYLLHELQGHPGFPSKRMEDYGNVRTYLRRKKSLTDVRGDYEGYERGYEPGLTTAKLDAAEKAGDTALVDRATTHLRNGVRARDIVKNAEKFIVHLSFWRMNELFDLTPLKGARWIRCATEPYNDDMKADLVCQRRWLDSFDVDHNVRLTKEEEVGLLPGKTHVSGHGARPDLVTLIRDVNAKTLIPVHTEEEHLDHFAGLASDVKTFSKMSYRDAANGRCVVEL